MKSFKNLSATIFILFTMLFVPVAGLQSARAACAPAHIIYVSPSGNGTDGCSWATAFTTLQDALAIDVTPDQIWVAAGAYYPDEGAGQTNDDRNSAFQLTNGVSVYGGFDGTETLLSERDPDTNVTILSGDIGTVSVTSDNAYHVVTVGSITSSTLLDGFIIRSGNANGPSDNFGGGMYVSFTGSDFSLANITFTNNLGDNGSGLFAFSSNLLLSDVSFNTNTASIHGGGMYLDTSSPSLTNVTFTNNVTTTKFGGGMYTILGNPTLTNVTFDNNTSAQYGGGLYNINGSPILLNVTFNNNRTQQTASPGGGMHSSNSDPLTYTVAPSLTNVTFSNNQALLGGGGAMFNYVSNATLTNVTFSGNSAFVRGGAILNEGSNPVLNNVTFSGNTAPATKGGAMMNIFDSTFSSNPVIRNTILWDNGSEEIVNETGNTATITDSVVEGGCPSLGTCTNVINSNPNLESLADNGGSTETMAIGPGSSARNAGGVNIACAATDQRGVTRPQGASCDIGAFEAKLLTVTADPQTITYGNSDPTFTFQYTGFFGGDTESDIDTPPTCGVSGAHANVGTYPITCSAGEDDEYIFTYVGGTLTVNKATPTLSVTNSPVTYDGSPHSATVAGSVPGTVSNILTGGSATKTNAGTYAVTANFVPTDTANYNSLTSASAGNFIINKATPILSVTNSPVTYDGSPHAATVTASVSGTASNILTGGSATQTNAGTHAVTANFVPTDTANYNSLVGASAGNFVINKVTPTLSVTNSPVVYDGSPHSATVTGSVPGTASSILTGGAATQTNAGAYAVTANFVPTDTTNFNSLVGASAGNFVINKATPTVSVTNSPVTYNGSPRSATVTGSAAGTASNILTGGAATQTNAGTYAVTADFAPTDTANYNSLVGASAGNFVINKATPTLSVTNSPVAYDGLAHAATVSSSAPGTISNILTGGSAIQTNAGTYAVTADFVPSDTANYNSLVGGSAGNFLINKLTPVLSVTNSPVVYDGLPHAATVTGSVPGTVSNILTGGAATQTNLGVYAVTANFVPSDPANYNSLTNVAAGNFIITDDLTPPDTQLHSRPASPSGADVTLTFSSPDPLATFECRLDGGMFSTCASPKNYTSLASGIHTVEVRAKDPSSNLDATPASHTWTVGGATARNLKSKVIPVASLNTQEGATSGSLPSLGWFEQTGADDTPSAYNTFQTPGTSSYQGTQSFYLPSDVQPSLLSSLLLQVNFKGPASATQVWTWSVYDWNLNAWVVLGNTTSVTADQWKTLTFNLRVPRRFVSPTREIRVKLHSNNANGDAKIDYTALHLTYRPSSIPSPTPLPPAPPPHRPGIASARSAIQSHTSNP